MTSFPFKGDNCRMNMPVFFIFLFFYFIIFIFFIENTYLGSGVKIKVGLVGGNRLFFSLGDAFDSYVQNSGFSEQKFSKEKQT